MPVAFPLKNTADILQKKAGECGCRFVVSHPEKAVISEETMDGQIFSYGEYKDIRLRLAGRYQIDNEHLKIPPLSVCSALFDFIYF